MIETTDEMFARLSKGKAQCHCGAPAGDPCRGLASAQMILPHVGRPNLAEPDSEIAAQADAFALVLFGDQPDTEDIREAHTADLTRRGEWPELEPGSHTAGLTGGPFHRYAECTNDHCPIHPD